jgi:hypothetical protein
MFWSSGELENKLCCVTAGTVFIASLQVHLNSKHFSQPLFTNHMVTPYWISSHCSVHLIMSSSQTYYLMQDTYTTPAPLSHFFTRCIAMTKFRVMSLRSQGYTGDGSLLRSFGCRLGWLILRHTFLANKLSHLVSKVSN